MVSEIQTGQTSSLHSPTDPDTMGENNTPTALKGCGVKKLSPEKDRKAEGQKDLIKLITLTLSYRGAFKYNKKYKNNNNKHGRPIWVASPGPRHNKSITLHTELE